MSRGPAGRRQCLGRVLGRIVGRGMGLVLVLPLVHATGGLPTGHAMPSNSPFGPPAVSVGPGSQDLGAQAPVDAPVRARLRPEREEVEVGEPVVWNLEIEHPSALRIEVDSAGLGDDLAWVVLSEGARTGEPDPGRPGRRIHRAQWTLAALEAGEGAPGGIQVSYPVAGESREVEIELVPLRVVGLLTPDEMAPRPRREWREEIADDPVAPPWGWPLAALLLLVPFAWVARGFLRRRKHDDGESEVEPTPLEVLEGLRKGTVEVGGSQELHYRLTELLRHQVDEWVGRDGSALTDEEWLAGLESSKVPVERRTELHGLFESCAPIKYGGFEPTEFRVQEHIEQASGLARRIADESRGPDGSGVEDRAKSGLPRGPQAGEGAR